MSIPRLARDDNQNLPAPYGTGRFESVGRKLPAILAATIATTESTASSTTTTAGITTASARWASFKWTGLVHDEGTTIEILTIPHLDRGLSFLIGAHFDEPKTLGTIGHLVHNNLD